MEFSTLPMFTKLVFVVTCVIMTFTSIMAIALGKQDDEAAIIVIGVLFAFHTVLYVCVLSGMTISFGG